MVITNWRSRTLAGSLRRKDVIGILVKLDGNAETVGVDMAQENVDVTDLRESLNLRLDEPEVSLDSPWDDDVLNREQRAQRLTNTIRSQSVPSVLSIDGYWGTGKTFMLKRWQQELANQQFQAIYFNAWEDDFCEDAEPPLLLLLAYIL